VTIGTNLRQRNNVNAIGAKGVEVTANASLGDFTLSGTYAYSRSTVRASGVAAALDGLTPAQSPRHAANATIRWGRDAGPIVAATVRYVGAQFEDDLQANTLPHALTLDGFS
jgi:outer membrane receptor protein involved in Fe transport